MLTDIFASRYAKRTIWEQYTEIETKLLTQCYRIIADQLIPYYTAKGEENHTNKMKWKSLHDSLSMELGLNELASRYYSHATSGTGIKPVNQVCKDFVCANYTKAVSPDRFMKERISFVELAFRQREEELAIGSGRGIQLPGKPGDAKRSFNQSLKAVFVQYVDELNERFRQAGTKLNYHNGFIQVAADELVEHQIERPFWAAVSDPIWKNVDLDMKEALDRRDGNHKEPAFYAARALESTIKIISNQKGWTHGRENGAHNFIDNLGSAKNKAYITKWESEALKEFFTKIRNPLGHGPGSDQLPELTFQQTNWAIETCMSWIKSLIQRS